MVYMFDNKTLVCHHSWGEEQLIDTTDAIWRVTKSDA